MALNRAKALGAAEKLVRQGKLEEAIQQYQAISEDNPRDVNTINRIGDLFVRLRRHGDAIEQFTRIADFYASDGFNLKAIAMFKKITKLNPGHPEANKKLAELYAKQGLVIEARTQYLALADGFLRASKPEGAIGIYKKILSLEPGNLKVRLGLGELLGRAGKGSEGVDELVAVAGELKKRNMMEEAFKVLQKASRLQPKHTEALRQMVELVQSEGRDPSEIIDTLEGLAESEPGDERVLRMLAQAYLNSGRDQDFETLASAASTPAGKAALVETQARHHLTQGDQAKGLAQLVEAAERVHENGDPARAAALLEQVLEVEPQRVEAAKKLLDIWTHASDRSGMVSASQRLARLWCDKEDWQEAALAIEHLENLDPANKLAVELRVCLPSSHSRPASLPRGSEDAAVPSLEDLEKVVDLDMESEVSLASEISIPEPTLEVETTSGLGESPAPVGPASPEFSLEEKSPGAGSMFSPGPEEPDRQPLSASPTAPPPSISEAETSAPTPDPARAGQEVDEDFLSEHFTEAEVFLKYGLVEKAREQLDTILERYPDHTPSWAKLKEIQREAGNSVLAAEACRKLASIHRRRGDESLALKLEEEAQDLAPGVGAAPSAAPGPEETVPAEGGSAEESPPDPDLDLEPESVASSEAAKRPMAGEVELESEEELTIEMVEDENEAVPPESSPDPEKLGEVDFYLRQGLLAEAETILASLEESFPGNSDLATCRQKLEAAERGENIPDPSEPSPATHSLDTKLDLDLDVERVFGTDSPPARESETDPPPSAEGPAEEDFFDLASELREEGNEAESRGGEEDGALEPPPGEEASLDDVFRAFRKKVDEEVGEGDFETRYNLGIAYKEMGLLDEAIGEFQYSSRDPQLFLESCSILGICFKEKGMLDLAVKWYQKALDSTGHPEEDYQGLRYDLAEIHVERGEYREALTLFSEVYGLNTNYRDVSARVEDLRKRIG